VKMMGAVQPFISGAISKTVNMPESATVDDVAGLFVDAWKLGVKAIAIYRDNCKVAQPLASFARAPVQLRERKRLPEDRNEIGRKFRVGDYEGYIHVGLYEDGTPGDIFVDIAKEGTTLAGLMNSFMISVSLGLQYGVPLEVYVSTFAHMRFDPSGMTNDPDIRVAKSIVDYVFRRTASALSLRTSSSRPASSRPRCARAWRRRTARSRGARPSAMRRPPKRRRRARPRSSTAGKTQSSAPAAAAA